MRVLKSSISEMYNNNLYFYCCVTVRDILKTLHVKEKSFGEKVNFQGFTQRKEIKLNKKRVLVNKKPNTKAAI